MSGYVRAPGPRGPSILRVAAARRDPFSYLARLASLYGDFVEFRIGSRRAFLVTDPALIHEILIEHPERFAKSKILPNTDRLLGDSLFPADGADHARKRRAIQPEFRHERLGRVAEMALSLPREVAAGWQDGGTVDLHVEMRRVSRRLMLSVLFSLTDEAEVARLGGALDRTLEGFERTLHPFAPLLQAAPTAKSRRIREGMRDLERGLDTLIADRLVDPGRRGDVLDYLIALRLAPPGAARLDAAQLRHESIDLLVGSQATIALAMAWTLYELARDREAQADVRAEAEEVLGSGGDPLQAARRLHASRSALAEALRLHPPAWAFFREAKKGGEIGAHKVPRGSLIVLAPYVTHRDARYWDDPNAFDLGRWEPEARVTRPKMAYFPYGAGPRVCLGEAMAGVFCTLAVASLLKGWNFGPDGSPAEERALGMHPPNVIRARVAART